MWDKKYEHTNNIEFGRFFTLFEKHPISVAFVCAYFLSHKCVYWAYITHVIGYISAHLRHTFTASNNKKFWVFCENLAFLKGTLFWGGFNPFLAKNWLRSKCNCDIQERYTAPVLFTAKDIDFKNVMWVIYTQQTHLWDKKYVHTHGTEFWSFSTHY